METIYFKVTLTPVNCSRREVISFLLFCFLEFGLHQTKCSLAPPCLGSDEPSFQQSHTLHTGSHPSLRPVK